MTFDRRARDDDRAWQTRDYSPDPGKRTALQPARRAADWPGKHAPSQELHAPIQRQADLDPTAVQVDQYSEGTDIDRFNDCGPSVVLMVVRAVGAEAAFDALVQKGPPKLPAAPTLQQKLTYIRGIEADPTSPSVAAKGEKVDTEFSVAQVENALYTLLAWLGVAIKPGDLRQMIQAVGDTGHGFAPDDQDALTTYLTQHCGNGSAVIALGKPNDAAWGWGGEQDPARRYAPDKEGTMMPQDIVDRGNHFVMVWSPSPGVYTVMDPSWATPRDNVTLEQIVAFLKAQGTTTNLVAVPYAQIAAKLPPQQAKRGAAATATGGSGTGEPLAAPTRRRMEHGYFTDFTDVRVHQDGRAGAVGARAYAQGNELHFAPGEYRPGTPDGDRLIGHELAHVVQQRDRRVGGSGVVDDPALEAEADAHGDRVAAGETVRVDAAPATGDARAVQRKRGDGGPVPAEDPDASTALPIPQALIDGVAQAVHGHNGLQRDTTPYGQAVMAIWQHCAQHVPDTEVVKAFAKGPGASDAKLAMIGQLGAERARLEFLIGWMLQDGIRVLKAKKPDVVDPSNPDSSRPGNWENEPGVNTDNSTNRGTIVDNYEAPYNASGLDWCGMFVGFALSSVGMDTAGADHGALESVYRIKTLLEDDQRVPGPGEAVKWLDGNAHTGKVPALDTPRAGDVVVFAEHVAMVERYADGVIETIEGNVGLQSTDAYATDAASGERYTLDGPAPNPRLTLLAIWRPGLDAYGASDQAQGPGGDAQGQLARIQTACAQVIDLYRRLDLAGASAVNNVDSVATIAKAAAG
jgi:hypothetical protein